MDNSKFYKAQERWLTNNEDKEAWNEMYGILYDICLSCCKLKATSKRIPDLEGKAMDATLDILSRYKKRPAYVQGVLFGPPEWKQYKIVYVVTVCMNAVIYPLFNKNLQLNERTYSFEELLAQAEMKEISDEAEQELSTLYSD